MHHNITALRSYRATLIPHGVDAAQLDQLADARLLPVLRLKAASASHKGISGKAISKSITRCVVLSTMPPK